MKLHKILILLIVMFGVSCNESPTNNDVEIGNGRILLDGSIDGIKIGGDTLSVIQKLGQPDYSGSFISDAFVWGYNVDDSGALEIGFIKNYPVDSIYSVFQVDARLDYKGKTIEGIGIGSSRDFVRNRLGYEFQPLQEASLEEHFKKVPTQEGFLGTAFYFEYDENNYITKISMHFTN